MIALAIAFAASPATASAGPIDLRIAFRAHPNSPLRVTTVRCDARATGTVPRAATACRRLRQLGLAAFRPIPPGTVCTQISGGPSTVRITGTFLGLPLWAKLARTDGCAIGRWQRVAFLLPPPAAP